MAGTGNPVSAPEAPPSARCAGILFQTPDGRVLLMRRVDAGNYWSLPGGHIETGEIPEDAARREAEEETGVRYTGTLTEWTERDRDGVNFTTFLADVPDAFAPRMNAEHDLYTWIGREQALELGGLHPGMRIALLRADMDETDIAAAIRIHELTSPQWYANVLLVALRITGTGASYRGQLSEYVWRDPEIYLNDDFLKRCNGLPVIVEHPPTEQLDSEEFRDRVIGTIVLPYIEGDEVWGIARIYDSAMANVMTTRTLSTSPAVAFKKGAAGDRIELENGEHVLIESDPALLDHLAIVELGVWDKGGPPTGIDMHENVADSTRASSVIDALAERIRNG